MSRRAFLVGLAIIGLLVFSLYRAKYGAHESAEEIAKVEAQIEEAVQERTVLLGELSHLSRQEWVEEYAREELGMQPVRAEQIIREEDLERMLGPVEPEAEGDPVELSEVRDD